MLDLKRILRDHAKWKAGESRYGRADLAWLLLPRAPLRGAFLDSANIGCAYLMDSDMREASLVEANLRGASLRWADLRGADLAGADLRYCDLTECNLTGANLAGADLRGATVNNGTQFDADGVKAYLAANAPSPLMVAIARLSA